MTAEEIYEMKTGHHMDDLIAEHVMNWKRKGGYWLRQKDRIQTIEPTSFGSFEPSTDISASWEALDKLQRDNDISVWNDKNGKWACEINFWTVDDCDTVQEAICKAALLTVFGDKE